MIEVFVLMAMVGLILTLAAGAVRIVRGPTDSDRMLAAQLLGTGAVAVLILMSLATASPRPLDIGLVLALLTLVAVACFAAIDGGTDNDDR